MTGPHLALLFILGIFSMSPLALANSGSRCQKSEYSCEIGFKLYYVNTVPTCIRGSESAKAKERVVDCRRKLISSSGDSPRTAASAAASSNYRMGVMRVHKVAAGASGNNLSPSLIQRAFADMIVHVTVINGTHSVKTKGLDSATTAAMEHILSNGTELSVFLAPKDAKAKYIESMARECAAKRVTTKLNFCPIANGNVLRLWVTIRSHSDHFHAAKFASKKDKEAMSASAAMLKGAEILVSIAKPRVLSSLDSSGHYQDMMVYTAA